MTNGADKAVTTPKDNDTSDTLKRAQRGDFMDVAHEWYHMPIAEHAPLLSILRKAVPKIPKQHGMESAERYARPDELHDEQLKAAAEALSLGELEAAVEGEPPSAVTSLAALLEQVKEQLDRIKVAPDLMEGDQDLSEKAHAKTAASQLKNLSFVRTVTLNQFDDNDVRQLLEESIAEIAHSAFLAGLHTRAALGKTIEASAVASAKEVEARTREVDDMRPNASRGEKQIKDAEAGGVAKGVAMQPRTAKILAKMTELINTKGYVTSRAAMVAYLSFQLGSSPTANEQLWYRNNKEPK